MSEQADRSSAGSRALATRSQDRYRRQVGGGDPAGGASRVTPRERNLRAVPDSSPGEGAGSTATPRRTIVIRGQVADRYVTPRSHSSRRYSITGSYGIRVRPERAALWAVLLGLALVIVALASANL
ncbi:MAG TPA: hypothetical protein VFB39_15340 [Solirubrobacteraceae bacterium]|nr:hypothetical protein [Solirubrobacteraceae bacterium]